MRLIFKRIAKVVGILAAGFVVVVASLLLLVYVACEPPSLDKLARQFPARQSDLELLVRMSGEDSQLDVIDPTWMMVQAPTQPDPSDGAVQQLQLGKEYMAYSPETGISRERYDTYMRIFAKNDLSQGLRRYGDSGDIFFIVKSVGLLNRGYSNGYLYCGHRGAGTSRYPPCESSSTSEIHDVSAGGESYEFHKVAPNWFVYRDGPS